MAIETITKDCTALTDEELHALGALAAAHGVTLTPEFLEAEREAWVLCALAADDEQLVGGMLFTLERIGGTPCVLIELAVTTPKEHEPLTLASLLHEAYERALLAFPDEDVLVAAKLGSPTGYDLLAGLEDVVPRPGHRPTGEERAWSRRLAKRFGLDSGLDDRTSGAVSGERPVGFVVYRLSDATPTGFDEVFTCCKEGDADVLIAFGWAMAEGLADGSLPPIQGA
ncbi:hypothetical protein Afer_1643 [Acidimicrobium ferrooxidans DSM 10331]|uniref:N-acetyltransferase domain-containing protein n=1 Tax=Acidimicrobium ferrooxidans (strain DSM 10331 / JCM 15462 / NBRC 103882 / ICP) TaxID=525909 RepID=C7M0Q1_ACIFD|nr:hypothetical protein [Acidimicrobium ferrooxidans]ACU54559.1 hypothetical protein Afer_1643 [Acidimicrobium ferrooxidans DSM 10331]